MSKRLRKKRALERATPAGYPPGGAMMYVSPSQLQSIYGQTFYGTTLKNLPVGQTSLFSPGTPLPTQPGVNPLGLPTQFRFPVAYNSFPVDRTLGSQDIPSFEQLKRLAQMDYGIGLCERFWLDMVPKMTLKISLSPAAIEGGAEERDYIKEKTYFQNFFECPDPSQKMDIHSWMRTALINQSRYDELYIYKNRTRGGKLLGLELIDGSQMKPLLDDWGRMPAPPRYAYQQYPWGIPGWQYRSDQMVHYRETPSSDTPYGFSRIERIILITNLALRKQKMDLAHFTEGNIPAGLLMPPEGSNWTPDQLDSYEQSWNALIAGNLQQLARIKVVQPGFSYTPFVQPNFDSVFDRFMLNIRAAAYGMTMSDLGFTETVNKSSGDTQQDVTYSRTIGPIATIYAMLLTDVMHHDFPEELHGDMFVVGFGGYEEKEDLASMASAYTTLTNAGILGLSNASKLLNLPDDPGAPHIGRVLITKDGPIFLDDVASDKVRAAQLQAKMAGFELAANPQQAVPESENDSQNEEDTQGQDKANGNAQQTKQSVAGKAGVAQSSTQTSQENARGTTQKRSLAHSGAMSLAGALSDTRSDRRPTEGVTRMGAPVSHETRSASSGRSDQAHHRQSVAVQEHDAASVRVVESDRPEMLQQHTGMMIAFPIDSATAHQLALPDGESPDDMHVTLAFLGDMYDDPRPGKLHPAQSTDNLRMILSAFTANTTALHGRIGGIGRFVNPNKDTTPIVASIDAPGLQEWRRRLINVLASAGYHIADDFDFLPHCTLAYVDGDASMPIDDIDGTIYLNFDTLLLAIGDDRYYFPIGGNNVTWSSQNTEGQERAHGHPGRRDPEVTTRATATGTAQPGGARSDPKEITAEYKRWRKRAIEDVRDGKAMRGFTTTLIAPDTHTAISRALERCVAVDDVASVFERAKVADHWQDYDPVLQDSLKAMQKKGVMKLTWESHFSACDDCLRNEGITVPLHSRFPSGAYTVPNHGNCECKVIEVYE